MSPKICYCVLDVFTMGKLNIRQTDGKKEVEIGVGKKSIKNGTPVVRCLFVHAELCDVI